jgi:SAM-dependent methyltransferase
MSNSDQYSQIAAYMDVFHAKDRGDLTFYERLAMPGHPILELGCGTGRVAISLALRGHRVVGIDSCTELVDLARKKAEDLKLPAGADIEFHDMDACSIHLGEQRFGLVIAPWGVMLEVGERALRLEVYRSVLRHLVPDGAFAFESWFHGSGRLASWGASQRANGCVMLDSIADDPFEPGAKLFSFGLRKYIDEKKGISNVVFMVDRVRPGGQLERHIAQIRQYYVSPEETQTELWEAGFGDIKTYGSFDGRPLYDRSLRGKGRQIFVARP